MKLIIYFFFLLPTFLIAQNNLFFNRVLTFKMNSSLELSVPANKAWHIKSTNQPYISFKTLSPEYGQIVNITQSLSMLEGGVWLGEGDILVSTSNNSTFSILEYDVIPISTNTGTSESTGFSSSGLEFNQVINYTLDFATGFVDGSANNGHGVVTNISVPSGKVWKVQSVRVNYRDTGRNNAISSSIDCYLTMGRTFLDTDPNSEPIWFGEGSYEIYGFDCGSKAALTINAVEFNVIQ